MKKAQHELEKSKFITAHEVMEILNVSESTAYRIVKCLNNQLEAEGYIVVAGKVSRRYFEQKVYL